MTDWTQVPFCEYLTEINRLSMEHHGCSAYMDSVAYWKEQFDERKTPSEALGLQRREEGTGEELAAQIAKNRADG